MWLTSAGLSGPVSSCYSCYSCSPCLTGPRGPPNLFYTWLHMYISYTDFQIHCFFKSIYLLYLFMHICIVFVCQVFIHTCDVWWKQPVVWFWSEVQPSQHAAEQSSGCVLSCCVKNLVPEATSLKWMCVKQLLKNQFLCNELEVSNWNKHLYIYKMNVSGSRVIIWDVVSMRGIKGPPPRKDGLWTWQKTILNYDQFCGPFGTLTLTQKANTICCQGKLRYTPDRKYIFQPSFFRGYVSFQEVTQYWNCSCKMDPILSLISFSPLLLWHFTIDRLM